LEALLSSIFAGTPALTAAQGLDFALVAVFICLIMLIIASAFISGSEVAYFSLTPGDLEDLQHRKGRNATTALRLLSKPDRLLSTILVANNTINIAIIILSAFISARLFDFSNNPVLAFIIEVVAITFILLLFCEVMPKVYASRNQLRFTLFMAPVLSFSASVFMPLTSFLMASSKIVKRKKKSRDSNLSIDDLSDALELTTSGLKDDKEILRGIVRFGNINVSAIMCPRIDVTSLEMHRSFSSIMPGVIESGFSRIPVYSETFDHVRGILYVKDLLPHLGKPDSFKWQSLVRPPYVVPETKKISELLKEFQAKKMHMAIVVDEFGGTSGIVTLEDILEEIVGDITDETDEDIRLYRETGHGSWIFDGKILLNDFYRITGVNEDPFEEVRGDSETLAGLLLELLGEIPVKGRTISAGGFKFTIETVEKRRIREISVEKINAAV
jgi:putative hemolysin